MARIRALAAVAMDEAAAPSAAVETISWIDIDLSEIGLKMFMLACTMTGARSG